VHGGKWEKWLCLVTGSEKLLSDQRETHNMDGTSELALRAAPTSISYKRQTVPRAAVWSLVFRRVAHQVNR